MYQIPHFIQGQKIYSGTHSQAIVNPATGQPIGQVAFAQSGEVNQAVAAAKRAYLSWSTMPSLKRARILFRFKALLEAHLDELAALITQEHGKTLLDAKGSVQRGIDVVDYACGIPNHLRGSLTEVTNEIDTYSIRQPLGVCVGITPFNFPAMIALWMFPIAVACGNTFVLKPSEKNPACSVRLAELALEAGFPEGVINVVQGSKETVDLLLQHPDVKAVSFVGSTAVAEHVYHTATAHGKRVQAFGGAKNHAIIMPDADLDQAVDAIVGAAYGSAGERCMAISVVIAVGDETADALIQKIKPKIECLKIGDGAQPNIEVGPLISKAHLQRVTEYIGIGLQEGAKLVIDGRNNFVQSTGYFLGGSLFDQVTPAMRIYREEIFGPVLCLLRAADFEQALQWVNSHEYGNGTAIFTQNAHIARTFAARVQAGMVGINIPIPVPVASHSFGGWKRSMFGDIHMHGPEGVQFYTRLKTITQRWLKGSTGAEFSMPIH